MRCDQHVGLPPDAIEFLKDNEIPQIKCPCCNRPFPRELELIGEYAGMFGDLYPLHQHQLKDGHVADEYLQASPCSSGPCFFLGLRLWDCVFEWSEEAINKA